MLLDRNHLQQTWDRLAGDSFAPASRRTVEIGHAGFQVLYDDRKREFEPHVYMVTGLSFVAWPRLAAYQYRFVLVPLENLAGLGRWEIRLEDIGDWMQWSAQMNHVVTMSTLKSGASCPLTLHAQSFPLNDGDGAVLSALPNADTKVLVDFGKMPHFGDLRIEALVGYPINGLRFCAKDTESGRRQIAEKAYEFALIYDGLKAFNLVILPNGSKTPRVHFFPRRKDGQATYGDSRWQIAGIECNGLMQAKTQEDAECMDAETIQTIFREVSLNEEEFAEFLKIVDAF